MALLVVAGAAGAAAGAWLGVAANTGAQRHSRNLHSSSIGTITCSLLPYTLLLLAIIHTLLLFLLLLLHRRP